MPPIKSFINRLDRIKTLHEKKREDYAGSDPHENFKRAAIIASWFDDPVHKSYAILIGVKLARLANLLNKKAIPNNESVQDSFDDLTSYSGLFGSYVEDQSIETASVALKDQSSSKLI